MLFIKRGVRMNYEEFKKYVDKMNESIFNKLQDNEDELVFYVQLIKRFNELCKEKIEVEQKCKRQKEVIDKSIDFIEDGDLLYLATKNSIVYRNNIEIRAIADRLNDLLQILEDKEVSE